MAEITQDIENILFFNSTRTYTLALLDAFNNIKHWVKTETGTYNEEIIPIKFGNYEKSLSLDTISEEIINSGNYNMIPRFILSFEGMTKNAERTTNKFQKLSRLFVDETGSKKLNFGYNSVSYDFQFNLTLQARGMNEALMIVEQILPMFRPTYPLGIQEYPVFETKTETIVQIQDPTFEILDGFEDVDVNIITVNFELNLRGNLYMPLTISGPIETVRMFNRLWETHEIKDAQLASYYKYDVCPDDGLVYNYDEIHLAPPKIIDTEPVIEKYVSPCESEEI